MTMRLAPHEIHVYTVDLTEEVPYPNASTILSTDEIQRAERFHFPIHRQRFMTARASLRLILSHYLVTKPESIRFEYNEFLKPYVAFPTDPLLQFNLAHSQDIAIYAIANQTVGIDLEIEEEKQVQAIAKRFFSAKENQALTQLSPEERIKSFYHIWACKEAIVKALGTGLSRSLADFSVELTANPSTVTIDEANLSLVPLSICQGYAAALASDQPIHTVVNLSLSANNEPIIHGRLDLDAL